MDPITLSVTSELYSEKSYISNEKPTTDKKNVVSKFVFKLPPQPPKIDSDGDLIIQRKAEQCDTRVIQIEHSAKTALDLVGLQIWRGALLLADWLIHNNGSIGGTILELGSGVGLTSIVASMYAPTICTDINIGGILQLIESNIKRNSTFIKHPVSVKELDFTKPLNKEIKECLADVKTVIAADVIYDDTLTDAFINTLANLFVENTKLTVYVALEKRYVFTIEDLNSVAPCYEYFLQGLETLRKKNIKFQELNLNFPQYFDYERLNQLVLWKIYQ